MEQSPLRQMALSMIHKWKQPTPTGQRVCSMVAGSLILPALLLCPCTDSSVRMPANNRLELSLENVRIIFEYHNPTDFQGMAKSIADQRNTPLDGVLVADIVLNLPERPAIMHVSLRDMPGYKADCSITGSDIENLLFNFPVTLQAMASAMASAGSEEASQ